MEEDFESYLYENFIERESEGVVCLGSDMLYIHDSHLTTLLKFLEDHPNTFYMLNLAHSFITPEGLALLKGLPASIIVLNLSMNVYLGPVCGDLFHK
jgi:hypothetical protein